MLFVIDSARMPLVDPESADLFECKDFTLFFYYSTIFSFVLVPSTPTSMLKDL